MENTKEEFTRLRYQLNDVPIIDVIHCSAYNHIIGMGKDALPFILREIHGNNHPGLWNHALHCITREAIDTDWLTWGHLNGYLRRADNPKAGEYWIDGFGCVWLISRTQLKETFPLIGNNTLRSWTDEGLYNTHCRNNKWDPLYDLVRKVTVI
jgi:hypothetical protein